jgi:hypothetical protein
MAGGFGKLKERCARKFIKYKKGGKFKVSEGLNKIEG